MLSSVISYIDSKLSALGYMPLMYGLVDRIRVDGKELPAAYCNGEWNHLEDFTNGFVYHRIIGAVSSEDIEEEETVSCQGYLEMTYPMRLVFLRCQESFENNIYASEKVLNELMQAVRIKNNKELSISINADVVESFANEGSNNLYEVYESEYQGTTTIPLGYIMVSVDYNITIQGAISCFTPLCQGDYSSDYNKDYLV